ncbi:MAG: hypothetical protein IPF51_16280 [Dehalococcoidia bacterium]|uniref:hypothetical protein n=1 Tax=Candidatus Amarobacter glycogenicus TaxID=3140699 RepID=UPI0031356436|nr:hypothetical protein [Dehalococcoidia bacterium]
MESSGTMDARARAAGALRDRLAQLFEAAFDRTTRAFVLQPAQPGGEVFSPEELRRMAEICLAHDAWIISGRDPLPDLVLDGNRHSLPLRPSPEIAARTITLMAPSKTFNLAGLKSAV